LTEENLLVLGYAFKQDQICPEDYPETDIYSKIEINQINKQYIETSFAVGNTVLKALEKEENNY